MLNYNEQRERLARMLAMLDRDEDMLDTQSKGVLADLMDALSGQIQVEFEDL